MDAPVPARTSGTPFATSPLWRPSFRHGLSSAAAGVNSATEPAGGPQKPRWSGTARQLARRKPSRRQDEHPP